tara:strand:- start:365 stop:862 length:498 start_codon:yes stop_codon:yes gene_type:complete
MQEVVNGNLDVLKVLFERHHAHVYNFLYRMSRDQMLSEDITQDVFYKVMKYRSSYNNGNFLAWIFTIARNGLKTHYKRHKENHADIELYANNLIDLHVDAGETYSHLAKALDKLEASDRELLILNRFREIKYAELAIIVGSTEGAVKTKVNRALKKLKAVYFENI